jgi:SAM-dependent methyltransferase
MDLYNTDYYKRINDEEGEQASRLAGLLIWKYDPKSVLDVGCATGLYLRPFLDHGVMVDGVDYSESVISDEVLQIPKDLIHIKDITKEPIGTKVDLTLCIEVMEHIPESGAEAAIENITKTSSLVFFTAAPPGQGGVGHINCQPKSYWDNLFREHGFRRDLEDEAYIKVFMAAGYRMGWLLNNLMVFKKP